MSHLTLSPGITGSLLTRLAALAAAILLPVTTAATEIRGRVDSRNPYTGYFYPRQGAAVDIIAWNGQQWLLVRRGMTGGDGMYYFSQVPAGSYVLVVNGMRFPLGVGNFASQDVPPVLVP
jgi:hypothetical protein